jgi:hypothetical protein
MGRFPGAVIAGDDDAPVARETRQDGERRRLVEPVIGVDVGNMLVRLGIGRIETFISGRPDIASVARVITPP